VRVLSCQLNHRRAVGDDLAARDDLDSMCFSLQRGEVLVSGLDLGRDLLATLTLARLVGNERLPLALR